MDKSASSDPAHSILLLGNPNVGKTTLFNKICGLRSSTANYPGSTVEARVGSKKHNDEHYQFTDLPGAYSMHAGNDLTAICNKYLDSEDELKSDVALIVVDSTNLRRNLSLVNEVLHKGTKCVIALTMIDLAQKAGLTIDPDSLSSQLGCDVVAVNPRTGSGIDELLTCLKKPTQEDVGLPSIENKDEVATWANECVRKSVGGSLSSVSFTDNLDGAFTHPIFGLMFFAAIMAGLFWTIFSLASIPMDLIDLVFSNLGDFVAGLLPEGDINDFIVNGVIGGLAGTLVFLPQICILFFLINILEDTGYLARASFVMDRMLRKFGLPGQSFVPFLSAHACAIPAIMSARIVPDRRDRIATIFVAPFFSCSARLPVYVLLIGLMFADSPFIAGLAFFGCYVLGACAALFTALIMRRTVLPGESKPMMLELPTYKWPSLQNALLNTVDRAWCFLKNAGTVILAIVIILWWLSAYPRPNDAAISAGTETVLVDAEAVDPLASSFAGRIGKFCQPVFEPLGYDWKLTVGVMTSFAAREVFVSTLAVLTAGSDDTEDEGVLAKIQNAKRGDGTPVFNTANAASLLVFFVLAMQCLPTIAVTRRETGSTTWALMQLGYMSALAWIAAWITYITVSGIMN